MKSHVLAFLLHPSPDAQRLCHHLLRALRLVLDGRLGLGLRLLRAQRAHVVHELQACAQNVAAPVQWHAQQPGGQPGEAPLAAPDEAQRASKETATVGAQGPDQGAEAKVGVVLVKLDKDF